MNNLEQSHAKMLESEIEATNMEISEQSKLLAENIWRQCIVVCQHGNGPECKESHGHGLELDVSKVAVFIERHVREQVAKAISECIEIANDAAEDGEGGSSGKRIWYAMKDRWPIAAAQKAVEDARKVKNG